MLYLKLELRITTVAPVCIWQPSLHFKRVGRLWSVRIGLSYRALAVEDGTDFIWVWIGTHDEYVTGDVDSKTTYG